MRKVFRPAAVELWQKLITDGKWHHFVVTKDENGVLKHYVDGKRVEA